MSHTPPVDSKGAAKIKELSVVQAYIMDGEIDQPGHEDEVLIQLGGKFYDCTEASDEEILQFIKEQKTAPRKANK